MGKGACVKSMVTVRNYSTNTIMEKKTNRSGRGEEASVKDMEFSGG